MSNTLSYEIIQPSADFLSDSAILVQSWKKAHAYIRSHNWYADSLELDVSALRLNSLVNEWSKLLTPDEIQNYSPDPMRLVPAPKSHPWTLEDGWKPSNDENGELKLRPLAHLSIRDQSLSMATLICFANIVETAQGDPSLSINKNNRAKVVSYGHRLVSKWSEGKAVFKWGNAKLYRQYFEDYQQFVHRPEKIRQELFPDGGSWAIVQADLTQFYDLIPRHELLIRLKALAKNSGIQNDRKFFEAFSKIHSWAWAENDAQIALDVCKNTDESGLPQGLATSGFFANAYLIDFDKAIIALFDKKRSGVKWRILDYCRYVDDMRFVIDLAEQDLVTFEIEFKTFLKDLLGTKAPGLQLNEKKTQVMYGNSHSPNVPVAEAMQAVNNSVSGPLDVETARHALEMLEGLLAVSNSRQSQSTPTGTGQDDILRRILSVEPDVRNDTLERFVAHRWRKVFRSLRVMADADEMTDTSLNVGRTLLDQRAKTFAVNLLRKWILDPSNVRLLRVSLDLFPSHEHLQVVLTFLETYLDKPDEHRKESLICEYIAAELLRAGATETGFVRDEDELPVGNDIEKYRAMLAEFAAKQLEQSGSTRSWYFQQQALLCLAVFGKHLSFERTEKGPNYSYIQLHQALNGVWPSNSKGNDDMPSRSLPILMIAHQVSGNTEVIAKTIAKWITSSEPDQVQRQIGALLSEDSELLSSIIEQLPDTTREFWDERCRTIGYLPSKRSEYWKPTRTPSVPVRLLDVLSSDQNPFQQETAALRLARDLTAELAKLDRNSFTGTVTPAIITLRSSSWTKIDDPTASISSDEFSVIISPNEDVADVRFRIPSWCSQKQRLRVEIGQLLRAAILSRPDFSGGFWPAPVIQGIRKYRGTSTSWFKRKHGLLNERHGLGDRLLPMSPWMSEFLGRLLQWPGTHARSELVKLRENFSSTNILTCINQRLTELAKNYCRLSRMPLYTFPVPELGNATVTGKLKVAVVQTALPSQKNFKEFGAELNEPSFRRKHRRHLAAMLRLLLKTLSVRKGYCDPDEHIDVVLLPELSVHSDDVHILTRFADSAKCMVFCGLVFHPPARKPDKLINSGLWILPVRTSEGRSLRFVEQGKQNLTPNEVEMGITPCRPCQWVIEARSNTSKPWRLAAAICYDATDLSLAADLRNSSDAFIVSALNRDIGTFDAMVTALHYHMFQHVVLVNSAEFGGSTAQAPYVENYEKVIVHHHGMNQPIVSVIELDLAKFRGKPSKTKKKGKEAGQIKYPPAGVER